MFALVFEGADLKTEITGNNPWFCRKKSERSGDDVAAIFLRWTFMRAVFHRGYVLVAFLYFVVDAHLTAAQLTSLGAVMSVTLLLSDVPAGALADAISRRSSLLVGHALLASGMTMTAFVTAYPWIIVTQVLWGLGWAFSGGADVAWVTDELDRPERIDRVLAASARLSLVGGVAGMVGFGLLGWDRSLASAIAASGVGMAATAIFVAARFEERSLGSLSERSWSRSLSILHQGLALALRDKEILLVFAATVLSEGASIIGWLFPKELLDLGSSNDPIFWWTGIGIVSFVTGAVALRFVEMRIEGVEAVRRGYATACFIGVVALAMLAWGPGIVIGSIGMLLTWGVAFNVTRAISVIWVNRCTTSEVRATVLSCLSQAKSIGGIVGGFAVTVLARANIRLALAASAALFLLAGGLVAWLGANGIPTSMEHAWERNEEQRR